MVSEQVQIKPYLGEPLSYEPLLKENHASMCEQARYINVLLSKMHFNIFTFFLQANLKATWHL